MTTEEISEGNKLIAEFMGLKYYMNMDITATLVFYHKEWDWLMPVVEKIEREGYSTSISSDMRPQIQDKYCIEVLEKYAVGTNLLFKYSPESKLKAVWLAVVEFIKWYNENTNPKLSQLIDKQK